MNYIGSKAKYMNNLNNHFNRARDILGIDTFYDCFAGGLNVSINIDFTTIVTNEIDSGLVSFINKIIETDGEYLDDVQDGIDYDTYRYVLKNKDKFDEAYRYKILYVASYRNMVKGDQLSYGKDTYIHKITVNKIRAELHKYKQLDLRCGSYDELDIKPGSLIYCDPPYSNCTRTYRFDCSSFDYDKFYAWCIEKSKDNLVLVSSYFLRRPFECVDTFKDSSGRLTARKYKDLKDADTVTKDECLFVIKNGWGVNKLYHNYYEDTDINF